MTTKSLNLLKIMAFNQQHIEPDYLATYLHFLLNPSEHDLGCRYLYSFLKQIQRTLRGESFFVEILTKLKIQVESQSQRLPDQFSIDSKLDFDGIPLDLLITDSNFSVLVEIQSTDYQNSRLEDSYKHFIRHHPLKAGHRILCLAIGRHNYLPNKFNESLRHVDRLSFLGFDGQEDTEPSIQASIINVLSTYGYDINNNTDSHNSDYPPGILLLKDFSQFISNNMKGYGFPLNPDHIQGITYINNSQLFKKSDGYVYIPNGISGLLRMRPEHIETFKFGFIQTQQRSSGWLSVKKVNSYLKWFLSEYGSDTKAIISRRTKKRYKRGKCSKY